MRSVALLGSTGSIGTNTLDVIYHHPDLLRVSSIASGSNWKLLAEQAKRFNPEIVAISDEKHLADLRAALPGFKGEILGGPDGVIAAATVESADIALVAIVGAAGLPASFAALRNGKILALANKESLVMAGELLTAYAAARNLHILPVDSEHSAIHQCLRSGEPEEVTRIVLTASGGPFRTFSADELVHATPEMALKHPTWNMGAKITIDSASLINKALEIIEARWLFSLPAEKINVVVHPQSIIHSMVEFNDCSTIAQMGLPDMRVPIQYALTFPARLGGICHRLDLAKLKTLTFEEPDTKRFPGILLGWRAAKEGGTSGCILNAANEVAVQLFLNRKIRFTQIAEIVEDTMDAIDVTHPDSIEEILAVDSSAREVAGKIAAKL